MAARLNDAAPVLGLGGAERRAGRQGVRVREQPIHLQQDVLRMDNLLETSVPPPRTHAQDVASGETWQPCVGRPFWGRGVGEPQSRAKPPPPGLTRPTLHSEIG